MLMAISKKKRLVVEQILRTAEAIAECNKNIGLPPVRLIGYIARLA